MLYHVYITHPQGYPYPSSPVHQTRYEVSAVSEREAIEKAYKSFPNALKVIVRPYSYPAPLQMNGK
jgi:ribosomal protein L20A (L18A)